MPKLNNLRKLTRRVQHQSEKGDDNAIADFPEIRLACILLLSKIAETSKHKPNSLPKHAFVDFLDVLLHAELFRLRVVEQVDLALNTWNVYFTTEKPEEALPPEDARKFDEIIKRKDEWRLIYFKILQKTIALDLYYLSISKPWFASDFMVRLLEYNPHMFKSTDDLKPSPRNFIRLLTPDETNQIKDTTKKSLKHIEDSCEWLEKSFPNDTITGLYSEEFQEAYPPLTDIQRLDSLLYFYLKNISRDYKMVTTVLS